MTFSKPSKRRGTPQAKLPAHPVAVEGHRVDIVIGPFQDRQVRCQCSWRSGWWSESRLATDEWREHVGIDE